MTGLTRVILVACLFGVLKGTSWVVEGQHTLRLIEAVQAGRMDDHSPKFFETFMVALMALGDALSPGVLSEAERGARDEIRYGFWLMAGSIVVAGAVFVLPGRSRPRGRV